MTDIFENPWLLLTLAALSIVPAAILRQIKPHWGKRPLLIPLLLAALGIGIDAAVQTDSEQIHRIIRDCRKAAVQSNVQLMSGWISEDYNDGFHRSKAELLASAQDKLKGASIKKVRFQTLELTLNGRQAQVEMDTVVHFNPDSRYAAFGSILFVSLRLELTKTDIGRWCVQRVQITSVNNQPTDWGAVR